MNWYDYIYLSLMYIGVTAAITVALFEAWQPKTRGQALLALFAGIGWFISIPCMTILGMFRSLTNLHKWWKNLPDK